MTARAGESPRCSCNDQRSACVHDAAVGDPCVEDAVCSRPLQCDEVADVCRALQTIGEPCDFSCGDGWCEYPPTGTTGTCRAPQAEGAACTFEDQCAGDCDLERGVCIPAEALACGWVG